MMEPGSLAKSFIGDGRKEQVLNKLAARSIGKASHTSS